DVTGFKSVFYNQIKKKLNLLSLLYKELRVYVQVPYWNPVSDTDEEYGSPIGYKVDKDIFFEKAMKSGLRDDFKESDKNFMQHLSNIEEIANKMLQTFSDIQRIANKEPFEFILPWKW